MTKKRPSQASSWQNVNALYQIYPRSFQDSDGDGVGDLRGVINRLDYLRGSENSLGIDAIWFSPFYPSPQADMGYDVADYKDIDPTFGTLDDFKELIKKSHQCGLKVMIDFVPNHTSDQHPWFLASQASKSNDKSDFYVWRDAKPDGSAPNNWLSIFGGSAWQWHEGRGQYYLHTFLKEQPDLNWDNPEVRCEMQDVLRFWLDLGVDGFRADAVRWMSKDPELRDDPISPNFKGKKGQKPKKFTDLKHVYSRFWKNLFPYLRELTDVVDSYPDRIMIFEDYPDEHYDTAEQYLGFYGVNPEMAMPFNFEGLDRPFKATSFAELVNDFQDMIDSTLHTPVYCFSNHDQPRIVSRYGGEKQARLIALMQLTLPGLPVVYYGDELGMANTPIRTDQIRDKSVFSHGGDESVGRDPERTPMQWDGSQPQAGFTTGEPWLPVPATSRTVNVASELTQPDSFLSLYRQLLRLRSQHQVLRTGAYKPLKDLAPDVFGYVRKDDNQRLFILLNFGKKSRKICFPHQGEIVCSTHEVENATLDSGTINLKPYEGLLVEMTNLQVSL